MPKYQYLTSSKVCDWSEHIFGASASPRSFPKKLTMSNSSTVHGGQHDTKYVTLELLMHAAFVADKIWGFMPEPARINSRCCQHIILRTSKKHANYCISWKPQNEFREEREEKRDRRGVSCLLALCLLVRAYHTIHRNTLCPKGRSNGVK